MDTIELLKDERLVAKRDAEAAWSRLGYYLSRGLIISTVIFVLTLGYVGGDRLPKYLEAVKSFGDLKTFYLTHDNGNITKQYLSIFANLSAVDIEVLSNENFRDTIRELRQLWEDNWKGAFKLKGIVLSVADKIKVAAENLEHQQVGLARELFNEVKGNPSWGEFSWRKAVFLLKISKSIGLANDFLSNIRHQLSLLSQGLKGVNLKTDEVNKIKDIKFSQLLDHIEGDLKNVYREITHVRFKLQGLDLSIPVISFLNGYPVLIFLFVILVQIQLEKARDLSKRAKEKSRLLLYGGSDPNVNPGTQPREVYSYVEVWEFRLQIHHWIMIVLLVLGNLVILAWIYKIADYWIWKGLVILMTLVAPVFLAWRMVKMKDAAESLSGNVLVTSAFPSHRLQTEEERE